MWRYWKETITIVAVILVFGVVQDAYYYITEIIEVKLTKNNSDYEVVEQVNSEIDTAIRYSEARAQESTKTEQEYHDYTYELYVVEENLDREKIKIVSSLDTKFYEIEFINDEVYKDIKEITDKINYYGSFKGADLEDTKEIREKYKEVILDTSDYIDIPKTKNGLNGLEYLKDSYGYNPKESVYGYFDTNSDGIPELILKDAPYINIFTYDIEEDKVKLLFSDSAWCCILGDNKMGYQLGGLTWDTMYYEWDENGDRTLDIRFMIAPSSDSDTQVYMVGFPIYLDSQLKCLTNVLLDSEVEIIFDDRFNAYFFRITEEQYNELIKDFENATEKANLVEQTIQYSYDELFN